jgi:hypothetical protein
MVVMVGLLFALLHAYGVPAAGKNLRFVIKGVREPSARWPAGLA